MIILKDNLQCSNNDLENCPSVITNLRNTALTRFRYGTSTTSIFYVLWSC